MIEEIVFSSDTEQRKKWFTGVSFGHPAKMVLGLQIYLIERYTKPGETILDPMFGSGTLLVACALGRNVIGIELEQKFVDMAKASWEKIKSLGPILGYTMGQATIIQGDARNLPNVLADVCCFSPPYAASVTGKDGIDWSKGTRGRAEGNKPRDKSKEPAFEHSAIGGAGFRYSETKDNIGNLSYGEIDSIICSPPYANRIGNESDKKKHRHFPGDDNAKYMATYPKGKAQIGNLKSENYLLAMLEVYQNCHRILHDGGLMILVTKNFIRNKKIVDLAADTIKLCEKLGFQLIERLKRKLTQQSFWRILYAQKFPFVPKIEFEDILVFQKIKQ